MLMKDHTRVLDNVLSEVEIKYHYDLEIENPPNIVEYTDPGLTVEEFDAKAQQNWHMPQEYRDLDIVQHILELCEGDDAKLQRVGEELLLYVERDLLTLLQYLKYLVDTMRVNNIVWGVGRGSSVSSYVLYLIGVHKIDSMFYDLDIKDFLR